METLTKINDFLVKTKKKAISQYEHRHSGVNYRFLLSQVHHKGTEAYNLPHPWKKDEVSPVDDIKVKEISITHEHAEMLSGKHGTQ